MKVSCNTISGKHLPSYYHEIGYSEQTLFDLQINESYIVYSMCLRRDGILKYLIIPGEGRNPAWYPALIFDVVDGSLPRDWQFAYWGHDEKNIIISIWGYEELITDENHFDALSEMELPALHVFFKRKLEIEQ